LFLIYTRRSTDDKADNQANTLEWQRQAGLEYAQRNGLPLLGTLRGFCKDGVILESHSGHKKSPLQYGKDGNITLAPLRPKFTKLVQMLASGELEGLIVKNWERLSRNDQDSMIIKDLIDRKLATIHFIEAHYDHERSSGKMHRNIDSSFSEYYSQQLSERITSAVNNLHSEGKFPHVAPIGYLDEAVAEKPKWAERC